jgi:hypothetical protein
MFSLTHTAGDTLVFWCADTQRYAVVTRHSARGRRPEWVRPDPEVLQAIAAVLERDGKLYKYTDQPCIKLGPRTFLKCIERSTAWFNMNQLFNFGSIARGAELPVDLPEARRDGDPDQDDAWRWWSQVCATSEITPLKIPGDGNLSVWNHLITPTTPEFFLTLKHPVHAEPPTGFFAPASPQHIPAPPQIDLRNHHDWPAFATGPRYPRLSQLFDSSKLSAAARARLYTYLLASFHAASLRAPAPFLVVDSWEQAVGKTEILSALGYLFDGNPSNLSQPEGNANEDLVAHFHGDNRFAGFDNLSGRHNWNNTWLATMLTDRAASARPKYGRTTTRFCGRLAAASCIWGAVTLAPDLLSRTWRVPLEGWAGPLPFRCNDYAKEHRSAIIHEILACLEASTPLDRPPGSDRCEEFEAIGAGAFQQLSGLDADQVNKLLISSKKEVDGLGGHVLHLYSKQSLELPDDALQLPTGMSRTITKRSLAKLEGASARGYRFTNGKFRKEHEEAPE